MKTATVLLSVSAAAAAAGCTTGEGFIKPGYDFSKVKKCAVVEVRLPVRGSQDEYEAISNQLGDFLTIEMFKKGYDMIERQQVESILKEQKFQHSGATSNEDAAAIGRILNLPAVIVANVTSYGEEFSITAKMIETETGLLIWMAEGGGSQHSGMTTLAGGILGAGVGAGIGSAVGDSTGGRIGAVAGGLGGLAAGKMMEPRMQEIAKGAIVKMCGSLPQR